MAEDMAKILKVQNDTLMARCKELEAFLTEVSVNGRKECGMCGSMRFLAGKADRLLSPFKTVR